MKHSFSLLALLLFLSISSSARNMGDWESSGDMKIPYFPEYPYQYSCNLEISDLRAHQDKEGRFKWVAKASIVWNESSRGNAEIPTKNWKVVKRLDNKNLEIDAQSAPFNLKKNEFWLSFDKGQETDTVEAHLIMNFIIGNYRIPVRESFTFTRNEESFRIGISSSGESLDGKSGKELYMRAMCKKDR